MNPSVALVALIATTVCMTAANAAESKSFKPKLGIEKCVPAALAVKSGEIIKVEAKTEKGIPVYEFDIVGPDGKAWDIECNANTGKITETEQEVRNAEDPLFKAKTKVSESDARKIALDKYPGEIVESRVRDRARRRRVLRVRHQHQEWQCSGRWKSMPRRARSSRLIPNTSRSARNSPRRSRWCRARWRPA